LLIVPNPVFKFIWVFAGWDGGGGVEGFGCGFCMFSVDFLISGVKVFCFSFC
jgi:hypothetical protein